LTRSRRSWRAPDQTHRRCREGVAAEGAQHLRIKPGIPAEAQIDIGGNLRMVAGDLVEQLGDKARDAADALDMALSAQMRGVLRFCLWADNKAVFYATLKIRRPARVTTWPARFFLRHG
jgi:hypothetical protein